jgi:hypothetical protein
MSQNQHFVIKAIMGADPVIGVTASEIAEKYNVKHVPQVVSQLRERGHKVFTTMRGGKAFYSLPFGTRDQEAKLTSVQRANLETAVQLRQLFA